MSKYVALLRGINVSGQKIIRMDDLKKHVESIGYSNVQTYIQSGNVVFESSKVRTQVFEEEIQSKIKKKYGFDVVVIVKNVKQMEEILSSNPFDTKSDDKKKYVTLLSAKPNEGDIKELKNFKNGIDKFVIKGDVIFTLYDEGYGKSDFSNNFIEKKLKVSATTRNWNTMNRLLEMMKA